MLRTEVFLPTDTTLIPVKDSTGRPFNSHQNFTGKSPEERVHWTEVESPRYDGSSPKENGTSLAIAEGMIELQ